MTSGAHEANQFPGLAQQVRIMFLNCRSYTRVYDPVGQCITREMETLFANFQPDMMVLVETHLRDVTVATAIRAACGYERHFVAPCAHRGRPHGILVMWSQPVRIRDREYGEDWVLLKCGHGLTLAAVYTAPGDGGQQFRGRIAQWAEEGSRLILMGDLNLKYNGRVLSPYLAAAGLSKVESISTTRGSRPDREPTDVMFATRPYNRLVVAGPVMWDCLAALSDYHWPVIFRIPKEGFIHPGAPCATWKSRMVRKLANIDYIPRATIREIVKAAMQAAPMPGPPTRLFGTPGSMSKVFYMSPKKYAEILRGGGEFTASAADMTGAERGEVLRRTENRFKGNPPREEYSEFVRAHLDRYYPSVSPWRGDGPLMREISVEEVMDAYAGLRDSATTDLALQALGELLSKHRESLRAEYNTWVANGRCTDTWHIELCYIVIAKKGKMSVDHHRVIALERATGKLFFKIMERRLRAVYSSTGILGDNHLAFGTERSHVEILVGLKSVIDASDKRQPLFMVTHDWPNAYDYMSWGLLPVIAERLLGAGRFFSMVVCLFRDAPRGLYAGPGDFIGAIHGATNGGAQGNVILPLAWNLYCAPLVKALTASYVNIVRGATFGFCDDASGIRLSLQSVERFLDLCDEYVVATGSPLGRKHAVAGNAVALDELRAGGGAFARRKLGPPIHVGGAISYLGQCAHLDKRAQCAQRTCNSCFGVAMATVCEACIETILQNLRFSTLSPMNRAEIVKVYVLTPLAQQVWLCEDAWARYMAWEKGSTARPGRVATMGIRQAIHNCAISGPYNEALELGVKLGGAGLGDHREFMARQVVADFIRSAFGPTDSARVVNELWATPRGGTRNRVVEKALKCLGASLVLRAYPSNRLVKVWEEAHAAEGGTVGKRPMVTWIRRVDVERVVVCAAELKQVVSSRGREAVSELVETKDDDEAWLMAIWMVMRMGLDEERFCIASTPTAAIRVKRFRLTGHRKRLRLAYGKWLHQVAQTTMVIVSIEDVGYTPQWLDGLGTPTVHQVAGPDPTALVTLWGQGIGMRHDRFMKFMKKACSEKEKERLWERMARSKAGVEVRVPRAQIMSMKEIAWEQSARVCATKQHKMAWKGPLSPACTHLVMAWRFGGILKSGLVPTTRCRACGLTPYTATHVLELPQYRERIREAVRKYGGVLEGWGCPRWWDVTEWRVPGHGLLCALGYVPKEVEIEIDVGGMNKAQRIFREEGVLDLQMEFIRAFLDMTLEHAPEDGREGRHWVGGQRQQVGQYVDPGNMIFTERRRRRLLRRPEVLETVKTYKIKERTLVMFDGAARKTVSASSAVVYDTSTSFYVRLAYQHPRYRVAAAGERIGFVLAHLLFRRVSHRLRQRARESVAYVGDNETLMMQFSRDMKGQYRCVTQVSGRVRSWLRDRIPPENGSYFVHREHNWMADEAGNEVLNTGVGVLGSTEIGSAEVLREIVSECEEVWEALQVGEAARPGGMYGERAGSDSSKEESEETSSDESVSGVE